MTMLANNTITRLTARVKELEAMLRTASDMNEVYEERLQELEGALWDIIADCEADYPPSYGAIRNEARAALTQPTERTADE